MADIHESLVLEDKASGTLDKYIQKMTSAATTTENINRSMDATEMMAQRNAQAISNAANQQVQATNAITQSERTATDATQGRERAMLASQILAQRRAQMAANEASAVESASKRQRDAVNGLIAAELEYNRAAASSSALVEKVGGMQAATKYAQGMKDAEQQAARSMQASSEAAKAKAAAVEMAGQTEERAWRGIMQAAKDYNAEVSKSSKDDAMLARFAKLSDAMLQARGMTQQQIDNLRQWQREQQSAADESEAAGSRIAQAAGQEATAMGRLLSLSKEMEKTDKQTAAENRRLQAMAAMSDEALRASGATEQMIQALREWQAEQARIAEDEAMKAHIAQTVQAIQSKTNAMQESSSAAEKMSQTEEKASRSTEQLEKKTSNLVSVLKGIAGGAKEAVSSFLGLGQASTPLDGVASKLTRMAASMFTVRKLLRYMKDALAVAPDEIASSFTNLGNTIKTDFQRVFGAMLKSIQPGIDRLRASLESPGGQRFLLGLQKIAETAGKAVGWLAEQVGRLVDWIGNNWNAIMPTAVALAGLFAGKLLLAGAAAVAANLPLFAMIGIIVGIMTVLGKLGITASDVFGFLGGAIYLVGAFFSNFGTLVENVCNALSSAWDALCNNFVLFFDSMAKTVSSIFHDLVATILENISSILQAISGLTSSVTVGGAVGSQITNALKANGIDIYGAIQKVASSSAVEYRGVASSERAGIYENASHMRDITAAWNSGMNKTGHKAFSDGWNDLAWSTGEAAGRNFGKTLEDWLGGFNPDELDKGTLQDIKVNTETMAGGGVGGLGGIGASVANIEKEVAMSQEDIKHLADIAERRYVNHINLTTKSPVITVNGQNTGRMQDDANQLARMIAQVLMEQTSAGSTRSIVFP
jgi:hypothetical protein